MTLGEQIKQRREALNMTQEELAEKLDVSRQAVSKWEGNQSVPQGSNWTALAELLGLDVLNEKEQQQQNRGLLIAGWATAAVLFAALLAALFFQSSKVGDPVAGNGSVSIVQPEVPQIKSVRFYDENQEPVSDEALWYDASRIDSILLDCSGGMPMKIQMFCTPAGSETEGQTELLLTKTVLEGEPLSVLLSADALQREEIMGHVYFEVTFDNGEVVVSEIYNVASRLP